MAASFHTVFNYLELVFKLHKVNRYGKHVYHFIFKSTEQGMYI